MEEHKPPIKTASDHTSTVHDKRVDMPFEVRIGLLSVQSLTVRTPARYYSSYSSFKPIDRSMEMLDSGVDSSLSNAIWTRAKRNQVFDEATGLMIFQLYKISKQGNP